MFAVKTELVHFLFPMTVILLGAAAEAVLPQVLSVGFPLLIVASVLLGVRRPAVERALLAAAAGTVVDALGGLPFATTSSFILIVSLCARVMEAPRVTAAAAYPAYQIWLAVWTVLPAGALWGRLLVAVPLGVLTVIVTGPLLDAFEKGVAADAR